MYPEVVRFAVGMPPELDGIFDSDGSGSFRVPQACLPLTVLARKNDTVILLRNIM
jgi:hypothetical protein